MNGRRQKICKLNKIVLYPCFYVVTSFPHCLPSFAQLISEREFFKEKKKEGRQLPLRLFSVGRAEVKQCVSAALFVFYLSPTHTIHVLQELLRLCVFYHCRVSLCSYLQEGQNSHGHGQLDGSGGDDRNSHSCLRAIICICVFDKKLVSILLGLQHIFCSTTFLSSVVWPRVLLKGHESTYGATHWLHAVPGRAAVLPLFYNQEKEKFAANFVFSLSSFFCTRLSQHLVYIFQLGLNSLVALLEVVCTTLSVAEISGNQKTIILN